MINAKGSGGVDEEGTEKGLAGAVVVGRPRRSGAQVNDAQADTFRELASGPLAEAVSLVLKALAPDLAADDAVVAAVLDQARALGQS